MLYQVHPINPGTRHIKGVVECLRAGGVIIYPTDTVYGIGCDIKQPKAIERVCRIKGIKPEKANLSLICHDLSQLSDYTLPISNAAYKLMRKALPGPFTFILNANNNIPNLFKNKKKTVGIRIPDNAICLKIIEELGNPIVNTSVYDDDEIIEYTTDPALINEKYHKLVDIVIDGGFSGNIPSTVVDYTGDGPLILREGAGNLEEYL